MSTILIIDDEPGIRTVLSGILEDEKYLGAATLAKLRSGEFDFEEEQVPEPEQAAEKKEGDTEGGQ